MANYDDSDSSGAEDNDYTETSVLLGYASKDAADDTISHLGGRPTWLDPATPPSAALAKCKICRDLMVLVLQLNAELPAQFPAHERRLYVLTCRRKACRRKEGSIRVLRGVRLSEAAANDSRRTDNNKAASRQNPTPAAHSKVVSNTAFGESLFGAKPGASSGSTNPFSNPFSTSTSTSTRHANPFATSSEASELPPLSDLAAKPPQTPSSELPKTFASVLTLNDDEQSAPSAFGPPPPPEPWPEESALPAPYPLFYLADADYEVLDKVVDDVPRHQIMDIDEGAGSSSGGGGEDKDAYESTHDKTFQAFADRMAQNPEQVIRYEFRGSPLLYSKSDAVGKLLAPAGHGSGKVTTANGNHSRMPRCENCGAGRVFEVQVTPHAILELESEEMNLEGMDWGTIIVGVCERDCSPRGTAVGEPAYLEEWAGVQWEELSNRRM